MPTKKPTNATKPAKQQAGKRTAAKGDKAQEATTQKRGVGRPSSFTQDKADAICTRLAEGESLRTICLDDEMPSVATVLRWLADDDRAEFRAQYARAREAQAEKLAEEILSIADDGSSDWGVNEKGQEVLNAEAVARSRLRVDARKWLAGKLAPKKYGEKLALGGADDLPPINTIQTLLGRIGKSSLPVVKQRDAK